MKKGIKGSGELTVSEKDTASYVGSGTLDVLATPVLGMLVERTCWQSVAGMLEIGECTVGTRINITHEKATPVGMKVHCESELVSVDGKKLLFYVKAMDETGLISEGTHERFIVDSVRFQQNAEGI